MDERYDLSRAQEEAGVIRKKVESKEATDYSEAEKQVGSDNRYEMKNMAIFNEIKDILSVLKSLNSDEFDRFFFQKNHGPILLQIKGKSLVEISEKSISIAGNDITRKILPELDSDTSNSININNIKTFFDALKCSFIRLNHLGISYSCVNIENELLEIRKLLHGTNFKLYEEPSDSDDQRWFFIGNLENWENPLFEIVLIESKDSNFTKSIPHFQIDIDTNLTIEELESLTRKYLKDDFIGWKFDIPNYGIVLGMGELADIGGVKVFLGLGTDKRNTRIHREETLKLI